MSRGLKVKALILFIVEIISLAILGSILMNLQTSLGVSDIRKDIESVIGSLPESIDRANEEADDTIAEYDSSYKAKAAAIAYMIQNEVDKKLSDSVIADYAELISVDNLLVIDTDGNVLYKAASSPAVFTRDRFNQLKAVSKTGSSSDGFEIDFDDETTYRYYAAKIDSETLVVIEKDPAELDALLENTDTWKSILQHTSAGSDGFTFVVSAKTDTLSYYPDEEYEGLRIEDVGIDIADLKDGFYGWMTIQDREYYCGVYQSVEESAYIISAVPKSEIISNRNMTVGVVLVVFFVVLTLLILYAIFTLQDEEKNPKLFKNHNMRLKKTYYNKAVSNKALAISVIGLIAVFLFSLYMQTLFALSEQSISNNNHVEQIDATITTYSEDKADLEERYNSDYLDKCRVVAYIVRQKPELETRAAFQELCEILEIDYIYRYDETGAVTVTNSTNVDFVLSENEEDQSFEFRKLLSGTDSIIAEAKVDDMGYYTQYVGVALYTDDGLSDGLVQICVSPSRLEEAARNLSVSSVLGRVDVGENGIVFAIDKSDGTFVYHPNSLYVGKAAVDCGIGENQMLDGFCGYVTIDSVKYYLSCSETENYYVYVGAVADTLYSYRMTMSLIAAGISLICLIVICILLTFHKDNPSEASEGEKDKQMVDVKMPDGSVKKTETAASRWSTFSIRWSDQSPEQKLYTVIRGMLSVIVIFICFMMIFKQSFFDEHSMVTYVINGNWEKGWNVFALTESILIIAVISSITVIVHIILGAFANNFNAKVATICRLLNSLTKYVAVVAALYFCFAQVGVDTTTLLASAGILSLIIGLGAQSLISDIIAGLFIIFEGEFRVGDVVTISGNRGTVMEIGVRTTKIEEPGGNVRVIRNSGISEVLNMTKSSSLALSDFAIEYGESLERVEYILSRELPKIKERIPAIIDGPFYKGVSELGNNSVNIRIVSACAEGDRIQVLRDMNREMKLIFDKYKINIPFPQVVVNQPTEFMEATEFQKRKAEQFLEEQEEKSKGIGEEQH